MEIETESKSTNKRKRKFLNITMRFLIYFIIIILVYFGLRRYAENQFYFPSPVLEQTPDQLGYSYESVTFKSRDGLDLTGWWLPADKPVGTILHCHGNGINMSNHLPLVSFLVDAGFNVFVFDYRGYGKSGGGRPTHTGTVIDSLSACDYVLSRPDAGDAIGVFGQSLGAGLAVQVAAEFQQVKAVAIEGGFTSYRGIAVDTYNRSPLGKVGGFIVSFLVPDSFSAKRTLSQVSPRPVLIIHGSADHIIPVKMAHTLYEAAKEPKELYIIQGGGHMEELPEPEAYESKIISFFKDNI
jgi:uncharacterized protein